MGIKPDSSTRNDEKRIRCKSYRRESIHYNLSLLVAVNLGRHGFFAAKDTLSLPNIKRD